ncbi:cytidyltransferase [bacterium]|nr:cytidyltransferase [bacterium]MDY3023405.1 cytidyltransferase [Oliverpabstia sp.]
MKILAVIPARAGSKGIPNKNIRLVNNKPLIYYSIKNALDSRWITDVIVTTDSPEIEIIAKQMGVTSKKRNESLCGDAVTLDSVIYDAIPENSDYDYVITMQPTSPTLKASTLDEAIQYTVDNDLDTVISVINQPHLSWREEEGIKVPNYKERLNRQYLPAQYNETGAFVISKRDVITKKTRIGEKMDVFEISEEESVDIDTFADLRYVETVLQNKKVAIYVNGNNKRGMGHVYRALELADEFLVKPDIYYDINQTDVKIFGKTTHNLIPINGIGELLPILEKEQYNIMINDILTTSIDYMIAIRKALPNAKIINFEDDGEGIYKADLVINALYQDTDLAYVKTGEKYYISSKLFMFYQPINIKEKVEKVFISFGGADPQNYSDRLLNMIVKDEYKGYEFYVVLGRAKLNIEELMEYNKYENIHVLYDISNMPEIMTQCDIGITSRGRTGYELALLGIPSIAMAQNKREEKHGFVNNENGFSYIGLNPSDHIIEGMMKAYMEMPQNERQKYQDVLLSHDLKNGRKRVMSLINNL